MLSQRFHVCFWKILQLIEAGGFRYAGESRGEFQMCSYQDRVWSRNTHCDLKFIIQRVVNFWVRLSWWYEKREDWKKMTAALSPNGTNINIIVFQCNSRRVNLNTFSFHSGNSGTRWLYHLSEQRLWTFPTGCVSQVENWVSNRIWTIRGWKGWFYLLSIMIILENF